MKRATVSFMFLATTLMTVAVLTSAANGSERPALNSIEAAAGDLPHPIGNKTLLTITTPMFAKIVSSSNMAVSMDDAEECEAVSLAYEAGCRAVGGNEFACALQADCEWKRCMKDRGHVMIAACPEND